MADTSDAVFARAVDDRGGVVWQAQADTRHRAVCALAKMAGVDLMDG